MGARVLVVPSDVKRRRPYNSPLRAEQANGTRHRVLAAATDLFLQRGYTGTTITAVAEAAGVSPDTVYVSLGGKQGLLEGALSVAISDPEDRAHRDQDERRHDIHGLADPHERLRRLVELSCQTLARTSPIHAVIRGAADGHPFRRRPARPNAPGAPTDPVRNLEACIGTALCDGLTITEAAERYGALLSPELYHLLTVERRWSTRRFASWVTDLLDHDLLSN